MKISLRLSMVLAVVVAMGAMESVSAVEPSGGETSRGGRPSFDTLLSAFDADEDGELMENEVPGPVWYRLSKADADDNGSVSRSEFDSYRSGQGAK